MNDMSARLDAYFDGELAAAEFALLEQWLAADSRHRALLVAHATEALVLHDALRGMETDVDLASLPPQAGRWRTLLGYVHNVTTLSWILSVLIVSIILLSLGLWTVPTGQPSLPGTERSQFVARIERTSGATWSDETDVETGKRTDLFIGQLLELRGGWAEIKFDRGARAVLTAPAVVRIRSDNSCDLLAGELTARADAAAEFTVETIAASIIDVGTEFGVAVSGAAVDAEVFDGEIIVRRNLDGATEQRRLVAGQAVRIALGGNSVMVDASAGKLKNFVQASFAGGLPEQLEPLPVTRSLALWLAADRGIRLDAAGGVITWRDTLGGDNKTAENA
ncbi:MAG: FecR domain-containing protein, partial [Pirellulales bacterium]